MATRNPSAASHAARVASGLQCPDSPPAVTDARHAAAADGYGCLGSSRLIFAQVRVGRAVVSLAKGLELFALLGGAAHDVAVDA